MNTAEQRPRNASSAPSMAATQSCAPVPAMSSGEVPWPGRQGADTVKPAFANASPSGRMLCVVPVKPCESSTPTSPPSNRNGSAPAITLVVFILVLLRVQTAAGWCAARPCCMDPPGGMWDGPGVGGTALT